MRENIIIFESIGAGKSTTLNELMLKTATMKNIEKPNFFIA